MKNEFTWNKKEDPSKELRSRSVLRGGLVLVVAAPVGLVLALGHALTANVGGSAIGPRFTDELGAHRLSLTREDRNGLERATQQRREGDRRLGSRFLPACRHIVVNRAEARGPGNGRVAHLLSLLSENLFYPHGRTIKKRYNLYYSTYN